MATSAANPLASGDTAYLYRAAIGPRAQDYYLRQFARFDTDGKAGSSWNWAAYWTTLNWLLYRRMWGQAMAYVAAVVGLALLIFGVGKLVFNYSDTAAWLLFLGLLTGAFVVPGLYANAWFYSHLNEKITVALRDTSDVKEAATRLASQAPDNRRLLLLTLGNAVLLALVFSVVNWFQGAESALPQLAAREERVFSAAVPAPAPVARPASAPVAVVTAPVPVVRTEPAPAPPAPAAAPPLPPAQAVVASRPPMINAVDRAPAVTARADVAPPTGRSGSRPAASAAKPRQVYVWVIQVGAYAEEANVQKALTQVQALGLDAGAESFDTATKGRLTRVRVGPFARQAEANQAALRIKSLNLPVLVIRQRP